MMRALIVVLQTGAASIHLLLVPQEYEEDPSYGWAFLIMGVGQLVTAAAMLRPRRSVLVAATIWNAGIVTLWMLTRAAGIPTGSQAGDRLPIAFPDALATSLEITTVVLLLALVSGPRPRLIRSFVAKGLTGVTAALLVAGVTYAAVTNRSLCNHFDPQYGPLAAVDGHSLLSRTAPRYVLPPGEETTIKSGVLVNCASEPVEILKVEVLSAGGDAAQVSALTVLPVSHPECESSGHLHGGSDIARVPPTSKRPDKGIFGRFLPAGQGSYSLNGLRINYRYRSKEGEQVFATNVAITVASEDPAGPRAGCSA